MVNYVNCTHKVWKNLAQTVLRNSIGSIPVFSSFCTSAPGNNGQFADSLQVTDYKMFELFCA